LERVDSGSPVRFQEEFLALAVEALTESWSNRESEIPEFLGSIRDPVAYEKTLSENLERIEKALQLESNELGQSRDRYAAVFKENASLFLAAIDSEPPNYVEMLKMVKKHYAEEDALVASHFGPNALSRYRYYQRQPRTEMIALLSHFSGIPINQDAFH
jgi:hypothetical protein